MIGASDHRNSRAVVPESQSQRRGVGAPDDSDFRGFREPVRAQPDSPPYTATCVFLSYGSVPTTGRR